MHLTALDDAAWDSPWRRRHVGEKVLLSMGLVLTALLAPAWPGTVLVALVSIVAVVALARIDAGVLWKAMVGPLVFILIGALSVAVSVGGSAQGDAWWQWGPLSLGRSSVLRSVVLVGHGIAGSLAVMVLATTTPMCDLLAWLRRLHVPDPLIEVASLTYRLLFVLLATTTGILDAQAARLGTTPAGDHRLRRRFSAAGDAAGSVLVRSWDRARRMEDGLAGRGYDGELRTLGPELRRDPGFVVASVACLALIWAVCRFLPLLGH